MAPTRPPEGPLSGLRVLDLSRVLTGPFCSMILADLGADVMKVEELHGGDQTRTIPPFVNDVSHYFLAINRNKQSLAVDARTPEGREIILDLARKSDIVLENFRPGVMARLGLSAEKLREVKSDLIICSISGYGQTGSMSKQPSFDLITQALSGVMSINGEPDGPPTKLGIPMGDIGGGLWAAIAILSALRHRDRTGEGLHIDLSLLDSLVGLLGYLGEIFLVTGKSPGRMGSSHHSVVPYGRFPVKDGDIVIALHVGNFWRKFADAIGRGDLTENPKFRTTADRQKNRDELEEIVSSILVTKTGAEWHDILLAADIPHGTVNSVGEALNSPAIVEREMVRSYDHPHAGPVKVIGSPIRFDDRFPQQDYMPAPVLGEHTHDVLTEFLGYDDEKVRRLAETGVIGLTDDAPSPQSADEG